MNGLIHKRMTFVLTIGVKSGIFIVTVPATLRALRSTADQGGSSILYPYSCNAPRIKNSIAFASVLEMI